ncbi:MAG: hypothetical protein ABL921_32690, partial [Pirellula sp.]
MRHLSANTSNASSGLVPRLRLGTHCLGGSASRSLQSVMQQTLGTAGGACKTVGCEAEPRNQ